MQQNAPFCVLLKNNVLGGGGGGCVANPRPSTAFSLSRVGLYATHISQDDRISIIALCDLCPKIHVFMFFL